MSEAVRVYPLAQADCHAVARALELAARVLNDAAKVRSNPAEQAADLAVVGKWDELQRGFGNASSGSLLVILTSDVAAALRQLEEFPDVG